MTGIPISCSHCGRPIGGVSVWLGSFPYHDECTRGPSFERRYYDAVAGDNSVFRPQPLTEDRVRQIVRDEIVRATTPTDAKDGAA